jgi:hypothetical protein
VLIKHFSKNGDNDHPRNQTISGTNGFFFRVLRAAVPSRRQEARRHLPSPMILRSLTDLPGRFSQLLHSNSIREPIINSRSPVIRTGLFRLNSTMASNISGSYSYTDTLRVVHYGPGSLATALPEILDSWKPSKALIVTGNSLRTKVGRS